MDLERSGEGWALGSDTEILGLNPSLLWQVASLHWPILRGLLPLSPTLVPGLISGTALSKPH